MSNRALHSVELKFRPDIEGLRALAVAPVVLFHAFPSALPGGFVGVDVFFVISGFLITQLLLQRLDGGLYSVISFYGARIRRIFPALFFMLATTAPVAVWLLSPADLQDFGRTLGATALFFSNMELARTTGYFDPATELKPLVHTWSLAVEEQYYIVFPPLLALLHRRWRPRLGLVLGLVGLGSLALSTWWLSTNPQQAFYSAFSRTFELMIGSLLAVASAHGHAVRPALREAMAALGLGLIVGACVGLDALTPFPGPAALLPCLGTALLIWTGGEGSTWVGRLISRRPLRWLGALSFSLYLWHWPVLVFTRHFVVGQPAAWQTALAVLASLALAWASLRWIETPVRRAPYSDRSLLIFGLLCIASALTVSWVLTQRTQAIQGLSEAQLRLHASAQDFNPQRRRCHDGREDVIAYRDRCRFGDLDSSRRTAVWADSHGAELALALGEIGGAEGFGVVQITSSSCPPALNFVPPKAPLCAPHNAETLAALLADPSVDRVVLAARYAYYLPMDAGAFTAGLERSVKALTAAGKQVVLVEAVPTYGYPVPAALAALAGRGKPDGVFERPLVAYRAAEADSLALLARLSAEPGVLLLPTSELLCGTGTCALQHEGRPLYFDDNHLSMVGARRLARALPR